MRQVLDTLLLLLGQDPAAAIAAAAAGAQPAAAAAAAVADTIRSARPKIPVMHETLQVMAYSCPARGYSPAEAVS